MRATHPRRSSATPKDPQRPLSAVLPILLPLLLLLGALLPVDAQDENADPITYNGILPLGDKLYSKDFLRSPDGSKTLRFFQPEYRGDALLAIFDGVGDTTESRLWTRGVGVPWMFFNSSYLSLDESGSLRVSDGITIATDLGNNTIGLELHNNGALNIRNTDNAVVWTNLCSISRQPLESGYGLDNLLCLVSPDGNSFLKIEYGALAIYTGYIKQFTLQLPPESFRQLRLNDEGALWVTNGSEFDDNEVEGVVDESWDVLSGLIKKLLLCFDADQTSGIDESWIVAFAKNKLSNVVQEMIPSNFADSIEEPPEFREALSDFIQRLLTDSFKNQRLDLFKNLLSGLDMNLLPIDEKLDCFDKNISLRPDPPFSRFPQRLFVALLKALLEKNEEYRPSITQGYYIFYGISVNDTYELSVTDDTRISLRNGVGTKIWVFPEIDNQ
ncbi:hypothetical protein BGX34_006566 [Mortierella sp. NVP85]|nr:hypothetical protein BGX34_006566 [Mortierella sp. NVP85]